MAGATVDDMISSGQHLLANRRGLITTGFEYKGGAEKTQFRAKVGIKKRKKKNGAKRSRSRRVAEV